MIGRRPLELFDHGGLGVSGCEGGLVGEGGPAGGVLQSMHVTVMANRGWGWG